MTLKMRRFVMESEESPEALWNRAFNKAVESLKKNKHWDCHIDNGTAYFVFYGTEGELPYEGCVSIGKATDASLTLNTVYPEDVTEYVLGDAKAWAGIHRPLKEYDADELDQIVSDLGSYIEQKIDEDIYSEMNSHGFVEEIKVEKPASGSIEDAAEAIADDIEAYLSACGGIAEGIIRDARGAVDRLALIAERNADLARDWNEGLARRRLAQKMR